MSLSRTVKIIQRKTFKFIPVIRIFLIATLAGVVLWTMIFVGRIGFSIGKSIFKGPTFLYSVFIDRNNIKLKNKNGTTNILLLGIGGKGHDGSDLTDTIILVSVNSQKNFVIMTPVPRDVYLPSIEEKINAAYAIGEAKKKNAGLILAKDSIREILNVQVDYVVRVDFTGFEKAVDLLGGLDIYVDKEFVDEKYPITGHENDTCGINISTMSADILTDGMFQCRFERIFFDQGVNHMNGNNALKYARSRHANDFSEGTDFGRSGRQQKVLLSMKDKFFSTQTLLSAGKLTSLLSIYKNYIATNVKESEYDDFIKLFFKLKKAKYDTFALDEGSSDEGRVGLLVNPPVSKYGSWVLEPVNGDWTPIQEKFKKIIY